MFACCLPCFPRKNIVFFRKKTRVTRELRVREVDEWEPPMNQWFLSGYLWAIENTFTSWRTQTLSFQSAVPYCVQNVQMYDWHLPGIGHASVQPFLTKTEHAATYLSKGNEPKLQTCNHKSYTQHRKDIVKWPTTNSTSYPLFGQHGLKNTHVILVLHPENEQLVHLKVTLQWKGTSSEPNLFDVLWVQNVKCSRLSFDPPTSNLLQKMMVQATYLEGPIKTPRWTEPLLSMRFEEKLVLVKVGCKKCFMPCWCVFFYRTFIQDGNFCSNSKEEPKIPAKTSGWKMTGLDGVFGPGVRGLSKGHPIPQFQSKTNPANHQIVVRDGDIINNCDTVDGRNPANHLEKEPWMG